MAKLTKSEQELLAKFEHGELISVADEAGFQQYQAAARATAIKNKRINIRLSSADLMGIQARALEEGIPYQTLIASILRKYLSGRLVEKS